MKSIHNYCSKTDIPEGYKDHDTRPTFWADKAPADVDVFVVLAAFARREVVRTEETVVRQHQAACCHAVVIGMIGHRAAHASSQPTYGEDTAGNA